MIYSLSGTLAHAGPRAAVIECAGVGYLCTVSAHTAADLPAVGAAARLYTHLAVREDAVELFGFADAAERECFLRLTSISGVGPKVAVAILSDLTPAQVALAVASGDIKTLTRAQGVGLKLAQRIALEMKDKIGALQAGDTAAGAGVAGTAGSAATHAAQAVDALAMLGFSVSEASAAVGKLDSALPVETLLKEALKALGRS